MEDLDQKVPASLNKRFSIHLTVYSNAGDVDTKIYKLSDNTLIKVNGTSVNNVKTTAKLSMYSHLVDTDEAYELTIYHNIKSQEEFGEFVLYLTNEIGTTTQKFEITPEGIFILLSHYTLLHDPELLPAEESIFRWANVCPPSKSENCHHLE